MTVDKVEAVTKKQCSTMTSIYHIVVSISPSCAVKMSIYVSLCKSQQSQHVSFGLPSAFQLSKHNCSVPTWSNHKSSDTVNSIMLCDRMQSLLWDTIIYCMISLTLLLTASHCTIILMCLQWDHRLCNGRRIFFQSGTMLWRITSVRGERNEE